MVEAVNPAGSGATQGEENKSQAKATGQFDAKKIQEVHQATFNIPKIELHAHIGGCMRP